MKSSGKADSAGRTRRHGVRGVYEWKLSERARKPRRAHRMGNTRRIIWPTLLQNYGNDEIEAVLAHELGHHVHSHMIKTIVVEAWCVHRILAAAKFWTRHLRRHMFLQLTDVAICRFLVLVFSALSLLLAPALNAYSRFAERQADVYCWKSVPTLLLHCAMEKLGKQT